MLFLSHKAHSPLENHLLGALPESDFNRLMPYLELVFMPTGHELYVSVMNLRYVYFPTIAFVSLFYILESGATAVIAIVGNEGIVWVRSFIRLFLRHYKV